MQPVLPVVVVPEDATPEHVHVSIVDTPGGDAGMPKVNEDLKSADVVVLVYAVDDSASIGAVCSFWLKKFRDMKLQVPIILVGNKIDLRGGITDPRAAENMEAFIKPIMDNYREVEVCIECSAKTVSNIPEVFYFAQKAVLHPTGPLYDVDSHSLTDGAAAALRRIFTLCDRDGDGALNDQELNDFQYKCFSIHLAPDELDGVKKVVKENRPTDGLTKDGFLSSEGFLYLHMLFVQKGRLETTWIVLRKFGYSDDLRLSLSDSDKYLRADDQSTELTPAAIAFLAKKFEAADKDGDGLLSPSELKALFADCPDGPFPASKPVVVTKNAAQSEAAVRESLPNPDTANVTASLSGDFLVSSERVVGPPPEELGKVSHMTQEAFIARWAMCLMESPETVMLTLMYLGFSEPPLSALKTTKPRKRDRYNKTVSRTVFKVLVLGDPEVARADIVRGLAGVSSTGLASPGVSSACEVDVDGGGGKRLLVMKDVPETEFASLFGSRRELESADVMCIVFNSSSMESMEQAQRVYLGIQAKSAIVKIPVVFVSSRPEGGEDSLEVGKAAAAFCDEHGLSEPVPVAPREDDFGEVYTMLVGVAMHPQVACPDYYSQEDEAASSAVTALKVVAAACVVGGACYAAKRAYDYATQPTTT